MNYLLFDDYRWKQLLPLTYTRPVCEIRTGILTIREKWSLRTGISFSWLTQPYLQEKYPSRLSSDNMIINGGMLPSEEVIRAIEQLKKGEGLYKGETLLAARVSGEDCRDISQINLHKRNYEGEAWLIEFPWDIFVFNHRAIEEDFRLITAHRHSLPASNTNHLIRSERIFIEEGARVECSVLNATEGPIYIGKEAEIMEGSLIRGPFAMGEHAIVKMGAKIYGPVTLGPYCRAGGEISASVMFGYSNKAHDGYLGNAVIGEWCNLGANTNNSNLKNNYAEVKMWSYVKESFIPTGLQFCGLVMGDHSKTGINTMFNTGTVVGVNANIFGAGYPRNFIPSFSWGGPEKMQEYPLNKAIEVAEKVMQRRNVVLTETDKKILQTVFNITKKYRHFS